MIGVGGQVRNTREGVAHSMQFTFIFLSREYVDIITDELLESEREITMIRLQ